MTLTQLLEQIESVAQNAKPLKWKDAGDWYHDCSVGVSASADEDLEQAAYEHIALMSPATALIVVYVIRSLLNDLNDNADGEEYFEAIKVCDAICAGVEDA